MGLESAERRLLEALRELPDAPPLSFRVAGGRAARRYAHQMGTTWYPSRPGRFPWLASRSADLVHVLDLPPPRSGRFVATIHDLAPLRFHDEGDPPPWFSDVAARAWRIVTPSHFTATELQELLGVSPDKIRVIRNGPAQVVAPYTPALDATALADLGISPPFVLRMGGYTERKNVPQLLAAWPRVRQCTGATLVLVGPAHAARAAHLAAAPSLDGVVTLDYVSGVLVPGLIRAAHVLASPSVYEGFGLPPLEAMGAGTPVVAVRTASVVEVCGSAAILVENEPGALADGIMSVLDDGPFRQQRIEEGLRRAATFNWDDSAAQLLAVYREIGDAPD